MCVIYTMEPQERENGYGHILKYTSLFGGVQGINILVALIRNKFIAQILGPLGMGYIGLYNSTVRLVSDATSFGLSMSAVKRISEDFDSGDPEKVGQAIRLVRFWELLTALLGMAVCIILSPLLSEWTFKFGDHALHFVMLSPVVAITAITGGETAILKGTRQLHSLAAISVWNIIAALFTTIPLYWFFGIKAIVPSLIIMALTQMLLTIGVSFSRHPLSLSSPSNRLRESRDMVTLGTAFVLAGIMGSGAEMVIRSYLNNVGDTAILGLYNAGYMMTVTYAGMVFSAMETDYFPQLAAINAPGAQLNALVNRQMEVSLLIIAPLLTLFIIAQPILLPLLYSHAFMGIMGMAQVSALSMFMRALYLPVEYIPLSRGDSRRYLIMESSAAVLLVGCVYLGYHFYGLTGIGLGILASSTLEFIGAVIFMALSYGYKPSDTLARYIALFIPLGITAYLITYVHAAWLYWLLGMAVVGITSWLSLHIIVSKTQLMQQLRQKLRR